MTNDIIYDEFGTGRRAEGRHEWLNIVALFKIQLGIQPCDRFERGHKLIADTAEIEQAEETFPKSLACQVSHIWGWNYPILGDCTLDHS